MQAAAGLSAFGWNGAGQLGTGDKTDMKRPGRVVPLADKHVSMVACGGPYTVLATDDDEVWAFGANARGQLGLGEQGEESLEPRKLDPPRGLLSWRVEMIACGYAHTVFLVEDLSVFSCGANSWGQLGLGHTDDRDFPCLVEQLSRVAVRQLDCGAAHTMVVCDGPRCPAPNVSVEPPTIASMDLDGDEDSDLQPRSPDPPDEAPDEPSYPVGAGVYGFGRNKEGQLGLGAAMQPMTVNDQIQKQPQRLAALAPYLGKQGKGAAAAVGAGGIELRCGGYHTAVLVDDRKKVLSFGQNCFGQLGLGDMDDRFSPEEVILPAADVVVKMLACGGGHTVVVTEDRNVFAFGRNNRGQLGVGDMEHKDKPAFVEGLHGKDILQVECGSKHTMVLTRAGDGQPELYAIGRNTEGQLGMGDVDQEPTPTLVQPHELFHGAGSEGLGHLSVGGFSAHNFFVPVPQMWIRRKRMVKLLQEQRVAVAMAGHRRLGSAQGCLLHRLSQDLVMCICSMIDLRRSGIALTEGEAILRRSPSLAMLMSATATQMDVCA